MSSEISRSSRKRGVDQPEIGSTLSVSIGGVAWPARASSASSAEGVASTYDFIMPEAYLGTPLEAEHAGEIADSMASFDALGTFSKRMDEPTKASRPFDADRDGLIPSGGAAALVLEDYDHAVARGATILAEVCGYGFSSNGGGISQPSDEGSMVAMLRAMNDAGVTADDIDYVNAHATSTPQGDTYEAIALTHLFEGRKAWISSTKSMTGHECWMAGASEAVYSILMMRNRFVAPNINLENPDEHAATLRLARTTVEDIDLRVVLSNSFGFGGTNSALVLKNYK